MPSEGHPASPGNPFVPTASPVIPDHELLRLIGRGAYGEVWLARNAIGTLRAVKIVHRQSFGRAEHFEREFKGLLKFEPVSRTHEGLVHILQIGRRDEAGYFFYVMELADATNVGQASSLSAGTGNFSDETGRMPVPLYSPRTLRSDLDKGPLPPAECVTLGLKLASALEHMHANGLVHRDIKLSNIIFVKGEPKLADIGLVTAIDEAQSLVGTAGYIPPEGPGMPQADLYSLGKVLYEIAFGKDRQEFPQLPLDLQSHRDYAALLELNEVILKACETDPRQRYQGAEAMGSDLELLNVGKSIKQKRTRQWRWTIVKRAGLTLSILAIVVALICILPRLSRHLAAKSLCDKAITIVRNDDYTNFAKAYSNLKEAIELDPNFAHPYVGLLELARCATAPGLSLATLEDFRDMAQHLNQLAPHSAAAYCAQSIVNWQDWRYPEALRDARAAIKADPNYEFAHTWYAWLLLRFGWPEEAWQQAKISERLTPNKAVIHRTFGDIYYAERNFTNAIAQYQIAMQWPSHSINARREIGWAFEAMGNYTNALKYFDQANGPDRALREALAQGGIPSYWQRLWERTENNTNTDFYWKGVIQIHFGNTNAALYWLQKSCETHEYSGMGCISEVGITSPTSELLIYEQWDGLHDAPRFKRLLDEVGFTKVMPPPKK
jgi:serine/threonine protein kinase